MCKTTPFLYILFVCTNIENYPSEYFEEKSLLYEKSGYKLLQSAYNNTNLICHTTIIEVSVYGVDIGCNLITALAELPKKIRMK